jgi:hypothetical protein
MGSYYELKEHYAAGQGDHLPSLLRSQGSQGDQVGQAGKVEP